MKLGPVMTREMYNRDRILKRLRAIPDIKILFAAESGSRAWGFESGDSDYDVRFIYCHPYQEYLRLDRPRDTIEIMEGDLDLVGWDIYKAAGLLLKSNPNLLEWLCSPINYVPAERSFGEALAHGYHALNPLALYHHYRSMMRTTYREKIQGVANPKRKAYLYLLRAGLCASYVRVNQDMPPILFNQLIKKAEAPPFILGFTRTLLDAAKESEQDTVESDDDANSWAEAWMDYLDVDISPVRPNKDFIEEGVRRELLLCK